MCFHTLGAPGGRSRWGELVTILAWGSCRSTPGPGQYDPKKTAKGAANATGDPSGSHTVTTHGFSADRSCACDCALPAGARRKSVVLTARWADVPHSGQSRDVSLRDYATTGPWATYRTARSSDAALANVTARIPGQNEIPGAVGPQALSTKANAPIAPFGTAQRFGRTAAQIDETPGPGTYDTTNVQGVGKGKIVLTADMPSWSLGKRLESSILQSMGSGVDTPGAEYDAHKAKAIGGTLSLSQKAVMGKAQRTDLVKVSNVPGPGFYKTTGSLGNQMLSQYKSEPRIQFTKKLRTSDMPNGDPVFISRQHGADRLGRSSPGPSVHMARLTSTGASYIGGNMTTSYGSKTRTIGFTKEKKLRPVSTEGFNNPNNPGPGQYKTTSSMGKQTLSKNPSAGSAHKTTTERDVWPKQFLSADHLRVEAQGKDSPGPIYDQSVTAKGGSMIADSKRGAPFGTSTRDATLVRITSPGPAAYSVKREFDDNRPKSAPRKLQGLFSQRGVSFSTEQRPCLQVSLPVSNLFFYNCPKRKTYTKAKAQIDDENVNAGVRRDGTIRGSVPEQKYRPDTASGLRFTRTWRVSQRLQVCTAANLVWQNR